MRVQSRQLIEGRYLVEHQADHSGPVELHQAFDQQLERPITIQALSEKGAQDLDWAHTFRRHQQLASTIHNCSVLAVYDAGEWDGRPFSVMERDSAATASALCGGQSGPTDLAAVLRVARQAAEALQCCRDAGLSDWAFSYRAVRVDPEGNARLALIEGLDLGEGSDYASNNAAGDSAALDGLLRVMLLGNPDPKATAALILALPQSVIDLMGRLTPGRPDSLISAGEVAGAIGELETTFGQPTQAWMPSEDESIVQPAGPVVAYEPASLISLSEAPTLAAQAAPALVSDTAPHPGRPYTPPGGQVAAPTQRRDWRPLALALGGLLLLALLLAAFLPRLLRAPASAAEVRPTTTPNSPRLVSMLNLQGKTLDEAVKEAGQVGLNVTTGQPVYDPNVPVELIASQQPGPGGQIAAGSAITVSLSLGPEPQPTAPQANPSRGKKGGEEDHGKKKGDGN